MMEKTDQNSKVVVKTHRSGHFHFRAGIDIGTLKPWIDRIEDAHSRFSTLPLLPEWVSRLEKEVVASSIFGTISIEGGTLTEEETAAILNSPEEVKEEKERWAINAKNAYQRAENFAHWAKEEFGAKSGGVVLLIEEMFLDLHEDVTEGLTHPNNVPGKYRNNPKEIITKIGDADHGGVYMPPKCLDDIKMLMKAFIDWINSDSIKTLSPLIRAPLAHYYFERIHPFWDGNGRVGRVVEAMILKTAGYKYASFALARYYSDNIDEYFLAFNLARKAEKESKYPNNVFIEFFLKGMLEIINKHYDRIKALIAILVHNTLVTESLEKKEINRRQYTILKSLQKIRKIGLKDLQAEAWYQSLYENLTDKTRSRDLRILNQKHFINISSDKIIEVVIPSFG